MQRLKCPGLKQRPGLLAVAAILTLAAACDNGAPDGGRNQQAPQATSVAQVSTPGLTPVAAAPLLDRTSCSAIAGTAYRSDAERAWYIANCSPPTQPPAIAVGTPVQATFAATPPPTPQPTGTQPPAADSCPTEVTISAEFAREYYLVSGQTLDQINASMLTQAPTTDEGVASGVTEYKLSLVSSRCAGTNVCKLGAALLSAEGKVLLPKHSAPETLEPNVQQVWGRFETGVAVHEDRHVTIVKEGLEDAKRQLLALPTQPTCADLDRVVAETWRGAVQGIDQRQDSFHIADRFGVGGVIVQ